MSKDVYRVTYRDGVCVWCVDWETRPTRAEIADMCAAMTCYETRWAVPIEAELRHKDEVVDRFVFAVGIPAIPAGHNGQRAGVVESDYRTVFGWGVYDASGLRLRIDDLREF